jgi:hypothetical protein
MPSDVVVDVMPAPRGTNGLNAETLTGGAADRAEARRRSDCRVNMTKKYQVVVMFVKDEEYYYGME